MQDFRNLLRQRLGAIPEPQAHPDPDILSAYAEQVLTPVERQKIQEHLAACSPCREVVALSLPQLQEESAQVVLRPAGRSWALGLRWAALAAMIVMIIGLAVWQPWREKSETQSFATASNAPAKSADTTANTPAAAPSATLAQAPAAPVTTAANTLSETKADLADRRLQGEPLRRKNPASPRLNFGSPQPAEAAKALPTMVAGGVAGPANLAANNSFANNGVVVNNRDLRLDDSNNSAVSAPTPKTQAPLTAADAFASRSAPPISAANIGSVAAGVTTDQANKPLAAAPAPLPSSPGKLHQAWTFVVKAPGKVAGAAEKTESSVTGAGANAFAAGRVRFDPHSALTDHANTRMDAMQVHSSSLHWSISPDGKLIKSETRDQWHEAYPQDQDLQFRTVWTDPNGHEVWAGGSHLTIIHSWNGGVNWQKMQLDQVPNSGDITNISIDDGSVLVKTSNGQTFVSHDKGATWVPLKQPGQTQQPK